MEYRFRDISQALPVLMEEVLENGEEVGSRLGRVQEILFPHIILEQPWRREIRNPGRKASLPAQIAETMWVLSGRNDVTWLKNYVLRAEDYSDDGHTWRGAYGKRLRAWPHRDAGDVIDQLAWVVDLLKADRSSRRAVVAIYDPSTDSRDGKDIPCNNWLHFLSRDGYLHLHVTIRSNDLMWGWSGINAFEWSAIQEIVAGLLGVMVGELHFSISSLHLYDRHWKKAKDIFTSGAHYADDPHAESPRFDAFEVGHKLEDLDMLIRDWFELEGEIRTVPMNGDLNATIHHFPEPMLRSWLQVIAWWWTKDTSFLEPLLGTPLYAAALDSPRGEQISAVEAPAKPLGCPTCGSPDPARHPAVQFEGEVSICQDAYHAPLVLDQDPMVTMSEPFVEFVSNLHAEKHKVYRDSWKRRGEQGIISNIARKVDRLGEAGAGDTAADTAIDELVYLVKYRLWLTDALGAVNPLGDVYRPDLDGDLSDLEQPVTAMLYSLLEMAPMRAALPVRVTRTREMLTQLEELVQANPSGEVIDARTILVETLTIHAAVLAQYLWEQEQHPEGRAMDRFLDA